MPVGSPRMMPTPNVPLFDGAVLGVRAMRAERAEGEYGERRPQRCDAWRER